MLPRRGVPAERPAAPRARRRLLPQLGGRPRGAAVGGHLDRVDPRPARPRSALEPAPPRLEVPAAAEELGDARRRHQRARQHPRHRRARVVLVAPEAVGRRLLVARERLGQHVDPREPLDVRHPVPPGDQHAQREAVLRRQRRAVDRVRQQRAVERDLEREAALVGLLDVALHAAVEAREEHLHRAVEQPRLAEHVAQRHAGPLGGADGLEQPRLADRPRVEPRAAVARALHRHRARDRRPGAQVLERERQRGPDAAADLQPPRVRVDTRDVVVDQQVVQAQRGDGPAQRFQRHPVVARGQLELLYGYRQGRAAYIHGRDDHRTGSAGARRMSSPSPTKRLTGSSPG